eukprot:scaffold85149_cov61-Phaeocystis_antarctica.AAC.3
MPSSGGAGIDYRTENRKPSVSVLVVVSSPLYSYQRHHSPKTNRPPPPRPLTPALPARQGSEISASRTPR